MWDAFRTIPMGKGFSMLAYIESNALQTEKLRIQCQLSSIIYFPVMQMGKLMLLQKHAFLLGRLQKVIFPRRMCLKEDISTGLAGALMEVHPRVLPMVLGSHMARQGFKILQPRGRTVKVPWPCTVARSCVRRSSRPESGPCFCPVLRPNFANLLVIILAIFLHVLKALEVSFPTTK